MSSEISNGSSTRVDRHELVRRANLQSILGLIVDRSPISRVDIAEQTGLSKPTVLNLVGALVDDGLIRSSIQSTGGVGRAPQMYEPNPAAGFVIGVDLGGSKVRAAVADMTGRFLVEAEEPTVREGGPALLDQLNALVRGLVRSSDATWNKVVGLTVGSPGVVDDDGTVNLAANIPGLDELALGPLLSRRLRCRVAVQNDVNVAAVGERAMGAARECRTFVVLSIGTGVGMGLVIDGRLISGAHGGAGEVAYLPIGIDPASAPARRRGALEVVASGSGVQQLLIEELATRSAADLAGTTLRPDSTARDVYASADSQDPIAYAVVERHARILAEAILAVAAIVDPEVVVLAGGIGSNPVLLDPVRRAVGVVAPFPIRVETTSLGTRAGVVGAVAHARRNAWLELYESDPLSRTGGRAQHKEAR